MGTLWASASAAKAAHLSAKAANRAAVGSDAMLAHAEASAQRRLRAYVFLNTADLLDGSLATPPIKTLVNQVGATITIRNSGLTPAYGVSSWLEVVVADVQYQDKLTPPIPLQVQSSSAIPSYGVINKIQRMQRKLTSAEVAGISAGTHGIFIYGRIEYKDAFKFQRFANFRLVYSGQWPPIKGAVFTFCNGGNETDEKV